MNFVNTYRRSVLALFTCCVAVLSVIVDGQSTIDDVDNVDEGEISKLIIAFAELKAVVAKSFEKISKLEDQLAATSTIKPGASKFSAFLYTRVCVILSVQSCNIIYCINDGKVNI